MSESRARFAGATVIVAAVILAAALILSALLPRYVPAQPNAVLDRWTGRMCGPEWCIQEGELERIDPP